MSSVMDPSSIEEKAVNHGDECMNSLDKEDNLLNDEIFDILFPSSPTDGTEEKEYSHVEEFHEYEFMQEKKEAEQNTITHSINEETNITDKKTHCYNVTSSENESTNHLQCNNNFREHEYNEKEINEPKDVLISISKDKVSNTNYDHSTTNKQNLGIIMNDIKYVDTTKEKSNNYMEKTLSNTKLEHILPTNEDLVFDYSDASLSDEEHDKSINKLNVNLADFLVSDELSDRKLSLKDSKSGIVKSEKNRKIETKNKKEYLNLGNNKIKTISNEKFLQNENVNVNENDSSKTKITMENKMDISKNNGMNIKRKYDSLKNEVSEEKSNGENNKFSNNTKCEKEIISKSAYLKSNSEYSDNGNENIKVTSITNKEKVFTDNATNRKISEKTKESLKIKKQFPKRGNVLEDEAQKKELDPQNEATLEDISDDEMEDSCDDRKKKKKYEEFHKNEDVLEDISDDEEAQRRESSGDRKKKKCEEFRKYDVLEDISEDEAAHKREWATEEKSNKAFPRDYRRKRRHSWQDEKDEENQDVFKVTSDSSIGKRLGPVMKLPESPERRYDEIIIIGDERLPSLKSYKNVKIFRVEELELRKALPFIRDLSRSGLLHDNLHSRLIILCLGLNDIISRIPSICYSVNKTNKHIRHSPCYLFRYETITYDLFSEIMRGVEKIIDYLPVSYSVKISSLYLFDLKSINKNLSLEHHHKYGHYAKLSELDHNNNDRIHALIKKVNRSLRNSRNGGIDILDIDELTMKNYQQKDNTSFTDDTRKLMVNNIKTIQRIYSNSRGDAKASDIAKDDLRWILNRSKKREVYSLREVLNSKTSRDLQTDNTMEGPSRKGWHSPGRCISPTGWHPEDICRKKEQERVEKHKRKFVKEYSEKSRSPRRASSEINKEEKSRTSRRIDKEGRIYGKSGSSRGKGIKEEMERKYRDSRISESISKKRLRTSERIPSRGKDGSVKRQNSEKYEGAKKQSPTFFDRCSQKSRSPPRTDEKKLDSATCEALRNLCEVHDRSCKMYIDNPAAHPDYNKEYYTFYEAKSQKIRELGGDPLQYDFLPEWQHFWQIRSKELFREAWLNMKDQCIKMMEEKKLTQEKKKMHEERRVKEDRSNRSKSVSSSPRSSSRSRNNDRNKRDISSDSRKPDYKKGNKSEKCNSPSIINEQKYNEKEHVIGNERDLNSMKDKLNLEILIEKELKGMDKLNSTNKSLDISSINNEMLKQILESSQKTTFNSGKTLNFSLSSVYEENDMEDLGLEEVGESVIPFNLGKYVPESEESKEKMAEKSNCSDNVLEVLIMLSQLGDKMGSLVPPIKSLLEKANQENMKNNLTINIFIDPDAFIVMQLVSSKLEISIKSENTNAIEKAIFQEVKNRVDKLLKSVEETFVEGVNIEHIAKKSLGMESSEIINCIKSVLNISTSSSFSVEKMMKIYKAVKDKQFRYVENTSNINKCSDSIEMAFPIQPAETLNDNDINLSPTEIPFNLPTRKTSNPAEKYDPFQEEYF